MMQEAKIKLGTNLSKVYCSIHFYQDFIQLMLNTIAWVEDSNLVLFTQSPAILSDRFHFHIFELFHKASLYFSPHGELIRIG